MTDRGRKRAGFTLVEVIIVLVVLAILAAIMVPALTGWIDQSKARVCESNRLQLLRYYQYETTLYYTELKANPRAVELQTVIDGGYKQSEGDAKALTCPSGGDYTGVGSATIYCTKHGLMNASLQTLLIGAMQSAGGSTPITFGGGSGGVASIDSTAPEQTGITTKAAAIRKWLEDHGISMDTLGMQSWKIEGTPGQTTVQAVTWSDQDVSAASAGTYVRAVSYNDKTGSFTVGYIKVESHKEGSGAAYNITQSALKPGSWYSQGTGAAQTFATYEEAAAYYGTLDATK